jgi:hypothetical protein
MSVEDDDTPLPLWLWFIIIVSVIFFVVIEVIMWRRVW